MNSIINPRQTVLVSSSEMIEVFGKEEEKDNLIAVDWHMPISMKDPMYAICINTKSLSSEIIRKSGVFCVNFMPYSLKDNVIICGRNSGRHMNKFFEAGLLKMECEKIDCVRVKEALSFIECEVVKEEEISDHVVFYGRIVFSDKLRDGKRLFHVAKDEFTSNL